MKKLNVAVVGLSFGLEFVPIYLEHPDVEKVYLVDTDASLLHVAQNRYGIPEENCTCEIQEVLDDPRCTLSRHQQRMHRSQFEC